jgi:hypothetical protein
MDMHPSSRQARQLLAEASGDGDNDATVAYAPIQPSETTRQPPTPVVKWSTTVRSAPTPQVASPPTQQPLPQSPSAHATWTPPPGFVEATAKQLGVFEELRKQLLTQYVLLERYEQNVAFARGIKRPVTDSGVRGAAARSDCDAGLRSKPTKQNPLRGDSGTMPAQTEAKRGAGAVANGQRCWRTADDFRPNRTDST